MSQQLTFDHAIDFLDVATMQRGENCPFVREVLVDGADAYAGDFRNSIRRERAEAFPLQHLDGSFEDCVDCQARTPLFWLSPGS